MLYSYQPRQALQDRRLFDQFLLLVFLLLFRVIRVLRKARRVTEPGQVYTDRGRSPTGTIPLLDEPTCDRVNRLPIPQTLNNLVEPIRRNAVKPATPPLKNEGKRLFFYTELWFRSLYPYLFMGGTAWRDRPLSRQDPLTWLCRSLLILIESHRPYLVYRSVDPCTITLLFLPAFSFMQLGTLQSLTIQKLQEAATLTLASRAMDFRCCANKKPP